MVDHSGMSLEEFKARLPIAEVVGGHVHLTRRGRDLWGCCPFHKEKTASFHVVPDKGFYHCFGCGQHGNAIDFVMAIEGLDFGQALQRLAELTGLPAPRAGSQSRPRADQMIYTANQAAMRWFAGRLLGRDGEEAARYLAGRGLDRATIERFEIGYAPNQRAALKSALLAEGYSEAQLLDAGLIVIPEDGGPAYDRFRHRVMFPIADHRGRVVGFGGRALGEARAKYLNTPETTAFHKGDLLYGLSLARAAIRERGTVIVVEGYMDVIALAQAGFGHAVAPLGTAIGEAQLMQLWQLADEPIVCLDGDAAGLQAGHRLVERALPALKPGKSLRFAILPQGRDPDSVLRARSGTFQGAHALKLILDEAISLLDFLWARETATRSPTVPQQRLALEQRFRTLARTIPDRALSRLLLDDFFTRLRTAAGRGSGHGQTAARGPSLAAGVGAARLASGIARFDRVAERDLVWPIVAHPQLLAEVEEEFAVLDLIETELAALRDAIVGWYGEQGHLDPSGLRDHLCQIGFANLVGQLAERGPAWCRRDRDLGAVLEGWRACVAQRRRLAEEREAVLAV
ncbi:MAG TPA: DNA primase, partial [Geminicoccaceae bacterium]|nr:DNA primase [Geminicoccaceae bacterium]